MNGATALELLELLVTGAPAWHRDALCREYPSLNFVPARGESCDEQLAVCGRCAVRVECLEVALADPYLFGIWGGTSGRVRRTMRRARARAAMPPESSRSHR